jgi:hypothetical protein
MTENINLIKEIDLDAEPFEKRRRGVGTGSNFFAVKRETIEALFKAPTANRTNFVLSYFVLAAGTGADHRLTKWSAKACEDHVGVGAPRAKRAIEELIAAGLVELTDGSTRLSPQYRLPEIPRSDEPIFFPTQIVTGCDGETSMLRRLRETGDPELVRMLIDLYGLVQIDATHGVPMKHLRTVSAGEPVRAFEVGVHNVWALKLGDGQSAQGEWCQRHWVKAKNKVDEWAVFWARVASLQKIGALWFEPWIVEGPEPDAEPLMPVDFGFHYVHADRDETTDLSAAVFESVSALAGERSYLLERDADFLLPLVAHHRPPALVGVARLRVEPDTPGRRRAFAKRMSSARLLRIVSLPLMRGTVTSIALCERFPRRRASVSTKSRCDRFDRYRLGGGGDRETCVGSTTRSQIAGHLNAHPRLVWIATSISPPTSLNFSLISAIPRSAFSFAAA